ncbi:MAG: hypothetical protein ACRCWC_16785, partial [Plesiomonas shigelloides]
QLKADHPELVEAIAAEATAGQADALAAATEAGAQAERNRIADVRGQLVPGHEALIEQLAFDGKSTAADAALAIVAAEKQARESALTQLDADSQPVVPPVDGDAGTVKTKKRADFDALDQSARRAFLADGGKIID